MKKYQPSPSVEGEEVLCARYGWVKVSGHNPKGWPLTRVGGANGCAKETVCLVEILVDAVCAESSAYVQSLAGVSAATVTRWRKGKSI